MFVIFHYGESSVKSSEWITPTDAVILSTFKTAVAKHCDVVNRKVIRLNVPGYYHSELH